MLLTLGQLEPLRLVWSQTNNNVYVGAKLPPGTSAVRVLLTTFSHVIIIVESFGRGTQLNVPLLRPADPERFAWFADEAVLCATVRKASRARWPALSSDVSTSERAVGWEGLDMPSLEVAGRPAPHDLRMLLLAGPREPPPTCSALDEDSLCSCVLVRALVAQPDTPPSFKTVRLLGSATQVLLSLLDADAGGDADLGVYGTTPAQYANAFDELFGFAHTAEQGVGIRTAIQTLHRLCPCDVLELHGRFKSRFRALQPRYDGTPGNEHSNSLTCWVPRSAWSKLPARRAPSSWVAWIVAATYARVRQADARWVPHAFMMSDQHATEIALASVHEQACGKRAGKIGRDDEYADFAELVAPNVALRALQHFEVR
ncbi:hypothetical protein KFE25_000029 [Diacronema lutheri]|uniref:CS domain-containing protein n=1 Tax=Diacronema lutheri TaxID=2081491 RepID=A0A8J5XEW2_DIALT|nr:hypothetical protein KFE25_000029 [Diacronema lutheri]